MKGTTRMETANGIGTRDQRRRSSAPAATSLSTAAPFALLLVFLLAMLTGGCTGSRPPVAAWQAEFARYNRDARALGPEGIPGEVLRAAQAGSAAADSLQGAGRGGLAVSRLRTALADVRAALALAEMADAEARADRCALAAEEARRSWDDALRGLLQTEQVARRTADGVPRDVPDPSAAPPPIFPGTTLGTAGVPLASEEEIIKAWDDWTGAARDRRVATADLDGRFASARLAAGRGKAGERVLALGEAGRITQELEARVRRAVAEESCARAAAATGELGRARDAALRGTLDLERGLQDALRAQLEKVRAEAETRQDQLYDAMRQLEGKYASIRRDARGTIVSLADILFDFNKATLRREVEFALVRVATILNQFPEMKIRVEGHTDNVGKADYNLELSQRRAQAVLDFLATQQVAAERMTFEGFGMTRPVADNSTVEGRQKNRRVDLVIEETP
jgi:outer membrane protein OmpA-like peptidoglycan-associated protein